MESNIAKIIQNEINSQISDKSETLFLNEKDTYLINKSFEKVFLKKSERLDDTDEPAKYIYFVEEGLLSLLSERNVMVDLILSNTFTLFSTKTGCHIEALKKSIVWRIKDTVLWTMLGKSPDINAFVNFIYEKLLVEQLNRVLFFANTTPEERYLEIVEKKKELFQSIPLKLLASYIGVTPQALSRIRKRCNHK